jgi:hypothetical protein
MLTMQTTDIAGRLRSARLGHALMEAVPGAALEVGRVHGPAVMVGPVGHPGAEILPCQHRGALVQGITGGTMAGYVCALGLAGVGGPLYLRLLLPPGADLGTGVVAIDGVPERRLLTATTLCPHRAVSAARNAQTLPLALDAPDEAEVLAARALAGLRLDAEHDPTLGTTILTWRHRPHPAGLTQVEDAVRAAAAACLVEELLLEVQAVT